MRLRRVDGRYKTMSNNTKSPKQNNNVGELFHLKCAWEEHYKCLENADKSDTKTVGTCEDVWDTIVTGCLEKGWSTQIVESKGKIGLKRDKLESFLTFSRKN